MYIRLYVGTYIYKIFFTLYTIEKALVIGYLFIIYVKVQVQDTLGVLRI